MEENPISIRKNPNNLGVSVFTLNTRFNRPIQWKKEYHLGVYEKGRLVSLPNINNRDLILDTLILESGWKGEKDEIYPQLSANQFVFDNIRQGGKSRYAATEMCEYAGENVLLIGHFITTSKQKKQVIVRNLQTIKETKVLVLNESLRKFILVEKGGIREICKLLETNCLRVLSYENDIECVVQNANIAVLNGKMHPPKTIELITI